MIFKKYFLFLIFILLNLELIYASSLNLVLDKEIYAPKAELRGNIILNLTNELELGIEPKIIIALDNIKEDRNAIEVLTSLDNNLDIQESSVSSLNQENEKTFYLSEDSFFGFKLPKESVVDKIDFEIEGLNNNGFPVKPFIDVGDDNHVDWIYVGSFNSWSNEFVKSSGLSDIRAEDVIVQDNSYLYCSLINLPYSNLFNVSANVVVENTEGNISMQIYGFDKSTQLADNKRGECTLKNEISSNSLSCVINTSVFIGGEHLICFYNSKNEGRYLLGLDDRGENSYKCDFSLVDIGSTVCDFVQDGDFFIKVYKANYFSQLDKKVKLSDFSSDSFEDEISFYLENCQEDDENNCNVILSAGTENNKGKLRISNLNLEYTKPSGLSSISRKFYDIEFVSAKILGLLNGSFNNYSLSIPLEIFYNFTLPEIQGNISQKIVRIFLGSLKDEQIITINSNLVLAAKDSVENAKFLLDKLKNNEKIHELLLVLGYDLNKVISDLDEYELKLTDLEQQNLTLEEKSIEAEKILHEAESLLDDLPRDVNLKEDINYVRISPESIKDEILHGENEEGILRLQDEVNFDTKIRVFNIRNFNGSSSEKTLIKRTLTSSLGDYFIIEDISKEVAESANNLILSGDYSIINDDPIIKFRVRGNGEIRYVVNGNILDSLNKITTIVFAMPQEQTFEGAECGDGVCTDVLEDEVVCPLDCKPKYKINWSVIIILLILLILGAIYFNFFMGKRSLIEFFKKSPFSSKIDETNLRNYVLRAIYKKVPRATIYKILLQKKWTKEQIDYILNKIEKK